MSETVEQFLARGGKINTLAMGYTAFPDGNIPMSPKPRKEKITETPKEVIEQKNKTIRKRAPIVKRDKRPALSSAQIEVLVAEQMKVLGELYENFKHGDKKRFIELCKIAPKTLDNAKSGHGRIGSERWNLMKQIIAEFKFSEPKPKAKYKYKPNESPEAIRRNQVTAARKIAEANGESVFMAPCQHHGMTKYYLHGNQPPRCAECRLQVTKHHRELHKDAEQKDKDQRAKFNKDAVLKAVADGSDTFTGLCARCGYTTMKYSPSPNTIIGYTYRCIDCTRKAQTKYKESKRNG